MLPEYEPNSGLNETLRIDGHSFIYDPEFNKWVWDRWIDGVFLPVHLSGEEIHNMILSGSHRVTVWEEGQ